MMDSESEIDAFNDSQRHMHTSIRVFTDLEERNITDGIPNPPATSIAASTEHPNHGEFYSQPIPEDTAFNSESSNPVENHLRNPSMDRRPFDSFKTWSGVLERQLSHLRRRQSEPEPNANVPENAETETEDLPPNRYFDALEGPELDTLRASEVCVLPEDTKWPFLLRYPITSFGVCLGISSQAILWKNLATIQSMSFLHISPTVNLVLWCISVALMIIASVLYTLKVVFYFEAVRREYYHPIRVNFFFAPWIVCLLLAISVPALVAEKIPTALWYILMVPIFCLELKFYGQWMLGNQRRLSSVANPTYNLAIVGNFAGAFLGAYVGLIEGPIFFFAVGLAHYIVLFVTLYQKLPTNEKLPKELHPVNFLFVATPSMMALAWAQIHGVFDYGARIPYFIDLFLYFAVVVRINCFRGYRFSLTWWAYTFPTNVATIATIHYSNEVVTLVTKILAVGLSSISTLVVLGMFIVTFFHAFVLGDLFPNDIAIAFSEKKTKTCNKRIHPQIGILPDTEDIEASLKQASSTDQI